MFRFLPALILLASLRPALGDPAQAGSPQGRVAADVDAAIQQATLDPSECYRVIDLNFSKDDLKVYLESGYLMFTKPVRGTRLGAVFLANADGGDADVLLLPPTRSERVSLAMFTDSPNLEEHFKSAAFVFTDGTGEGLLAQLQNAGSSKKSQEMGGLIAEKWSSVLANLMSSFETRLVYDVLSGEHDAGLFYMGVAGDQLGDFDVVYDPAGQDQIRVGKVAYRDDRPYFNTWTAFPVRSFRRGSSSSAGFQPASPPGSRFALDNFRIDATIQPDLSMQAVTRTTLTVHGSEPRAVVPFSLSPAMRVTSASIDGRPAEIFDSTSLRSNLMLSGLMQASDDRQFLLIPEAALAPGTPHQIEIHHEGSVIRDAGNQVYYVGSRGTWYPRTGSGLADYEMTFRYPKDLTLAATGARVNDGVEGGSRITRVKTGTPVRFAGFNLGHFQSVVEEHNGYRVEVYANERLESALAPKTPLPEMPPAENPFRPHIRKSDADNQLTATSPPNPSARMEQLTNSLLDTLDFMTEEFGPSPIRNLAVTPIPGTFGQGFPGLVYLSTLAYLDPSQLPAPLREPSQETFYSELLETHEVAHQWWGNLVVPASYHDDWLIESLANYSALLMLERKKGVKALDSVLDLYRTHLLSRNERGRTLESSGPIIWGYRLTSSLAPSAWQAVTYEKGTWIIHMLRRRLGDEKFLALLREVASRRSISTEEFRSLASAYAPQSPDPGLKIFFDNWIYGTGIPAVKVSYTWRGGKLTGKIVQSDVDEDFSAYVPVEVASRNASRVYWFATGSDPVAFSIPLKAPPARVALLTADCLMTLAK